jgi:RNA polymerase sigma-70 factor (ECF subfamily)
MTGVGIARSRPQAEKSVSETAVPGKPIEVFDLALSLGQAGSGEAADRVDPSRDALGVLYREHHGFVWRNARRLGCPEAWVEDVVHEVFLVVARRLAEFEARSSPRTWIFAITYRVVRRMLRDRARRQHKLQGYALTQPSCIAPPQERTDAAEALRRLMSKLGDAKRLVFIMAELEGMTSVEIGDCLGISPRTVDSRLRTARLELSRWVERERLSAHRGKP